MSRKKTDYSTFLYCKNIDDVYILLQNCKFSELCYDND